MAKWSDVLLAGPPLPNYSMAQLSNAAWLTEPKRWTLDSPNYLYLLYGQSGEILK